MSHVADVSDLSSIDIFFSHVEDSAAPPPPDEAHTSLLIHELLSFFQKLPCELFISPPCLLFPSCHQQTSLDAMSPAGAVLLEVHVGEPLSEPGWYTRCESRTWRWLGSEALINSDSDSALCDGGPSREPRWNSYRQDF